MTSTIENEQDSTPTYEKGTWQASLHRASVLFDKSSGDRKRASTLLWTGGQEAITEWEATADTDVNAEVLYGNLLSILGTPRKGDASKIKTVAVAVRNHGLVVGLYPNLSKAYAEATRLTKTVKQDAADDKAADKAVEELAANAPHTATTAESAAKIVLAQGLDEAARLLLDALGATNDSVHRAFVRAITAEVAGRVKPKVSTVKAGPKAGATQAKSGGTKAAPAVKTAGTKAKPVKATKTTPVKATKTAAKKATPVQHTQAKPVAKRATPVKTTATNPVKAAEKAAPSAETMFSKVG